MEKKPTNEALYNDCLNLVDERYPNLLTHERTAKANAEYEARYAAFMGDSSQAWQKSLSDDLDEFFNRKFAEQAARGY